LRVAGTEAASWREFPDLTGLPGRRLALGESPTEDLVLLGPIKVLRFHRYTVAMTNKFNTKVGDVRQAS
jgi:hypothetical protein